MTRTSWWIVLLLALAPAGAGAQEDSALVAALRANRHALRMDAAGRLEGPGARVLLEAGRASQFFLVGEEHGIAEVPRLTGALFRELAPAGYGHLAVETGDALAVALNRAAAGPDAVGGMRRFLDDNWPGAPFFDQREEADLLATAVAAAGGRTDAVWGLDYDILVDRYALSRLREIAPTPAARDAADRVRAAADSLLRRALAERNPGFIFSFSDQRHLADELRAAYRPAPGSEADRIIEEIEQTLRVNVLWGEGRGYESNLERSLVMKSRFMRRWREAAAGGDTPRVMFRFGANHMQRGRTPIGIFDLGTAVHELAEMNGGRAFGLLTVPGRGTRRSALDPRDMTYVPAPPDPSAWAKPLHDLAEPEGWTVYDLRPLRAPIMAGTLDNLSPALTRVIFGFDAVVVLTGSTPSTLLRSAAPPR
ncbi:MAG TPA: hypothetical protein VFR81_28545 [Longimicrobium sp.]|nr:hypothetical protein [Longimicrobium sp.]